MAKHVKKDNIAIRALIISVISLTLTIVQFGYNVVKDIKMEKENISIIKESVSYDDIGEYKKFTDGSGLINGINYNIYICNNSKQKVSFLHYDLWQKNNGKRVKYFRMVKSITCGEEPLSFPLILDSGEAIRISINVNTIIPKKVNQLLEDHFNYGETISFDELNRYLDSEKLDFYGNKIKVNTYESGERIVQINDPQFPQYDFQITTTKDNTFSRMVTQ